jgi:transcriptional regulator with XRE-family HTH domain
VERWRPATWPGEERRTDEFPTMIRARRRELGLTQKQVAVQIQIEGRAVSQAYVADLEKGFAAPRPHLIEQFAKVLELDRDLLYLAARQVPPEVAEELGRLTPEERAAAWRGFRRAVMEDEEEQKGQARAAGAKGKGRRAGSRKG